MEKGEPKILSGQDANSWGSDTAKQKSILIGRFTLNVRLSTSDVDKFKILDIYWFTLYAWVTKRKHSHKPSELCGKD